MSLLTRVSAAVLLAVALLTGCQTSQPASSINLTLNISATAPDAPDEVSIPLGTVVNLHVTSEVADELHVHGYEKDATLVPGEAVDIQFTADMSGIYEVETHEVQAIWMKLTVG